MFASPGCLFAAMNTCFWSECLRRSEDWGDRVKSGSNQEKPCRLLKCVGAISLLFLRIPPFVTSSHSAIVVLTTPMHALFFFSEVLKGCYELLECLSFQVPLGFCKNKQHRSPVPKPVALVIWVYPHGASWIHTHSHCHLPCTGDVTLNTAHFWMKVGQCKVTQEKCECQHCLEPLVSHNCVHWKCALLSTPVFACFAEC